MLSPEKIEKIKELTEKYDVTVSVDEDNRIAKIEISNEFVLLWDGKLLMLDDGSPAQPFINKLFGISTYIGLSNFGLRLSQISQDMTKNLAKPKDE